MIYIMGARPLYKIPWKYMRYDNKLIHKCNVYSELQHKDFIFLKEYLFDRINQQKTGKLNTRAEEHNI